MWQNILVKTGLQNLTKCLFKSDKLHIWLDGCEKNSNLIFLNDLRWKPPGSKCGNIEWQDLLNMLEGLPVTLPAPMNSCSKHIKLTETMPIFVTSTDIVRYWVNDEKEPQTN